jgi:acetolactate synthase-1/2/3 large subunit
MQSGADTIVRMLKKAGVDAVFGIPSIHNIGLYNALRKDGAVRHVLCRQETAAAHMADGYARSGRRIGVVICSTGPGTGYVVPAIEEAWGSDSPVLVITTNIPSPKLGKGLGVLHEVDHQDAAFRSITKATFLVRSAEEIQTFLGEALRNVFTGRPGPVYFEIPTDLLDREVPREEWLERETEHGEGPASRLQEALTLLRSAKRPLIVVGTDAVRTGIEEDVRALSKTLGAPVVSTTNGKGVMPEDQPAGLGNAVRKGLIRETILSCDVALAVGTRLRAVDIKRRGLVLPQLIHVDWDSRWVNRNFPAQVTLTGDVPSILRMLLAGLMSESGLHTRTSWVEGVRARLDKEMDEIRGARSEIAYLDAIRVAMPRESTLFIDNTQLGYWAEYFYPVYGAGGLVAAKGSSTIGFAFPAAVGANIALPDKPIAALIGDGGFLYHTQELATCVRHSVGFPLIVANDNAFGVIDHLQRTMYRKTFESHLTNPDFVALAEAYGVNGVKVTSPFDLKGALEKAVASREFWLIELSASFPVPPFGLY